VTWLLAGVLLAAALSLAGIAQATEEQAALRENLVPTPDRALLTIPAANGPLDRLRRVELERGKSAVLQTGFSAKRVAVGDPEIADVVVLGTREIHLVGKAIGDTNVILWDTKGKLQAAIDLHVGAPHSQIENELRRVLANDSIEVDGVGEAVVLKGIVSDPNQMERAVRVADAFFPCGESDCDKGRVLNLLEVGGNQQVMIEVVMAEMSRSVRRNLGTNFSGITSTNNGTQFQFFSFLQGLARMETEGLNQAMVLSDRVNLATTIINGSDQFDILMEAIQENGLAKVLAEPTVIARSGESAHFLAGGEIPIPIPQAGAIGVITIEFKEFGVGVTFTPTVLGPDRIHLKLSTEVSEPDLTLGTQVQGYVVPAFNTRRASTGIELGDGESFAVAGLLREDIREIAQELPFFGDIPVLGALFRSTQFEKNETELVMIVTPRLVKPLPPGLQPLPTDHFIEPNAAELFLLGSLEGGVIDRLRGEDGETDEASAEVPEFDEGVSTNAGVAGDAGHRVSIIDVEGVEEDL
jgi:pilus assembly protein CpaC